MNQYMAEDIWANFETEEFDSLLEKYTKKYDKFIQDELDYYYILS